MSQYSVCGRVATDMPKLVSALFLVLLLASCADLARSDQGALQPQSVTGPCTVKKFYLLALTAVHTNLAIGNTGEACSFTVLNPAVQAVVNAALVTSPASHGRATAELLLAGRQAGVSYVPQPGYTGPDQFTITLQPNNHAISVAVSVQPAA